MPVTGRPPVARSLAVALAMTWVALGGLGAYRYVHRYVLYRGFPRPETPAGVARGAVERVSFASRSLRGRSDYLVYLPPGYAAQAKHGARFPVLYLLHGVPGNFRGFVDIGGIAAREDVLLARRRVRPAIFVMPAGRGGIRHGDTEWADTPAGPWMRYVVDVVHDVDHRFATLASRRDRGIAGNSEGAYGAMNIGLHHLAMFGFEQSWSGYYAQTAVGPFRDASPAALRDNSPLDYEQAAAARIRRLGFRSWMYTGRRDAPGPMLRMAAHLRAAGGDAHAIVL